MIKLISFDIDGTLEVGDPPGVITLDIVSQAHELGFLIGSCSDRPISYQKNLWQKHNVPMQFTVLKQHLLDVRSKFKAEHYLHIGDTDVDAMMAKDANFEFLHSITGDIESFYKNYGLNG